MRTSIWAPFVWQNSIAFVCHCTNILSQLEDLRRRTWQTFHRGFAKMTITTAVVGRSTYSTNIFHWSSCCWSRLVLFNQQLGVPRNLGRPVAPALPCNPIGWPSWQLPCSPQSPGHTASAPGINALQWTNCLMTQLPILRLFNWVQTKENEILWQLNHVKSINWK